ncbi:hypothetical protein HDF11_003238 [Tunturiibacter psychrotolerans]
MTTKGTCNSNGNRRSPSGDDNQKDLQQQRQPQPQIPFGDDNQKDRQRLASKGKR